MRLDAYSNLFKYDQIIHFETERTFDKSLTAKFADNLDFIPYFLNKKLRKEVCTRLNDLIKMSSFKYGEIDILSHSLGSIVALECGKKDSSIKVNSINCLQSPLHNRWYGWFIKNHVKKFCYGLSATAISFTYNKKDWRVANVRKNLDYLDEVSDNVNQYDCGKGHSWTHALLDLVAIFLGGIVDADIREIS